MRRIVLAASVALVVLLAAAGTAGAIGVPSHRDPDGRSPGGAGSMDDADGVDRQYTPIGVKLAGAGISGRVRDYYDIDGMTATVEWWAQDALGAWSTGSTVTAYDGSYGFVDVPPAAGTGELWVTPTTSDSFWRWGRYDMTWANDATYTFDFRPGSTGVSLVRDGPWAAWDRAYVFVWTLAEGGNGTHSSFYRVTDTYAPGDFGWGGSVWALPGAGDGAAVYFWSDEGTELDFTGTVNAGVEAGSLGTADQSRTQRIWLAKPYWSSGKPGSPVVLDMWNFPAGWTNDILGFSDSPKGTERRLRTVTSSGAERLLKLTIPTSAKPGYMYWIGAQHTNGLGILRLDTPFQVCTLKASKTSIRRGARVRLSGVVPTQGHWGSQAGKRKYVYVWKRTTSASQPRHRGDLSRLKGWTRVGRFTANGYGKYVTSAQRPTRTTWYVAYYKGDDWYWPAYTSVTKVKVY